MKKTLINTAVAVAIGASVVATPAQAHVNTFNFDGFFTILDPSGAALANTSIPKKGNNQFQTPIAGTMEFDTHSGAGTADMDTFAFFKGDPTLPASATGINMQAIGGTLVMGNMLFNWNTNNGIPVSIILDAAGFFAGDLTGGGGGATPASDGTYVGAAGTVPNTTSQNGFAYLELGPIPIATTAWNTTNACTPDIPESEPDAGDGIPGDCSGNGTSGLLPLIEDTAVNSADYFLPNTGGTIGGSPMLAGPFTGFNANFDVTSMEFVSSDANAFLAPNCDFDPSGQLCAPMPPEVPVPAAVWLFGSGLLGLVGVARRRKS